MMLSSCLDERDRLVACFSPLYSNGGVLVALRTVKMGENKKRAKSVDPKMNSGRESILSSGLDERDRLVACFSLLYCNEDMLVALRTAKMGENKARAKINDPE